MFYIDPLIILIILIYAWVGFRRGFLNQFFDLFGLAVSFLIALRFYGVAANIFQGWGLNPNLTKPLGFFALWVILQTFFYFLSLLIFHYVPERIHFNKINQSLGIIPGALKGTIVVAILLMIFLVVPISSTVKDEFSKYPISRNLVRLTSKIDNLIEKVFGGQGSLTFFAPSQQENEGTTILNFKVSKYTIDEKSENLMLQEVNATRKNAGLLPLVMDAAIQDVARDHSIDMATNGYFSHVNLAGLSPSDRLTADKINYWIAGENIALAPTYELAEIGFMNSPEHRDNILESRFGRIGIGIIDLGPYGRMVTQDFAN